MLTGMVDNHGSEAPAGGVTLRLDWSDEPGQRPPRTPETAQEALAILDNGSRGFANLADHPVELRLAPESLGFGPDETGGILTQEPFAAVLGCSDARVPIELALGQAANELFVVRVAGNAPSSACRGSLRYAAEYLPSVRLVAVMGHSRCGATSAAVDATLDPAKYLTIATDGRLREIIDPLFAGVNFAQRALLEVHGADAMDSPLFRIRLVTLATLANTALSALILEHDLGLPCAFGVYKLSARAVGVRRGDGWHDGFAMAPKNGTEIAELVQDAARSLPL